MLEAALKVVVTAVLVVAVAEAGKRNSLLGALLASLPLTSVLAFIWLWHDAGDGERIASLATSIFWLVLPSLVLFLVLPLLLRAGVPFWPSLVAACLATAAAYAAMTRLMATFGITG